ncbi:MAG: hypothetical protein M3680_05450 [Myxococcota bacterium]|nr:hypothetical protein [Myxococcota bacterium]
MPDQSKEADDKQTASNDEPEVIGKPHPGSERARDEQRTDGGPRYGGKGWDIADERGDKRFGVARNDDSDPSELDRPHAAKDDDEWPGHDASVQTDATGESEDVSHRSAATDDGTAEVGAPHEGMGRGEKPRKPAARGKT